jgi:type I restriction-modification system DNA methylase subunit/predicted type IV restriction endonuclease
MNVPDSALELIERFDRNRDAYLSGAYNEFQLRKEFLDPLFETLGWDMQNKLGYAEAYKDVIHEDSIKVGGFTKAPDYCFRVGGTRKFFVEAKKPSVNVKDDTSPAFQLRRYAWSAKLPLSILSDFEEFAVYDCRIKPVKTDKASTARILYMTYEQYPEKWDKIASIFARDSILKGSFDRYVETTKGKKGTAEVDAAFLKEIESWRDSLARNLALRNAGLSQRELNYAVQTLIDRIIFLRMCEDRGIEEYGRLMALQNGNRVYERMFELFQRADERYNSGLFHFREEKGRNEAADQLTPTLNVEDKPLKDIIKNLYYPDSPYEFAVLPADILGQVYEQFLGKVIRLTAGHHAVVEDKPEVKKAGGVYYTPTYIVDYIVENTVGRLLEGKTSKHASKLRILDPACGSGSCIIGTYQRLMDWHRDQYVEDGAGKHAKEVYQGPGGEWRLTTAERKRILLNNIFGVDIDPQAVEVTKLSLLLQVLEGESDETLTKQLQLFHERALPDLSDNIKCGNSLVGPDFYNNQQLPLLDEEERYRINAFDWNAEFSDIMNGGGFDAVIGNPPYIRMESFKDLKDYLGNRYSTHDERSDLYVYFLEKGHRLLRATGMFGMIVSNKFLRAKYGKKLRDFLSEYASIQRITDFAGLPVFAGATVRTIVIVTTRDRAGAQVMTYSPPLPFDRFTAVVARTLSVDDATKETAFQLNTSTFNRAVWSFSRPETERLIDKLVSSSIPLKDYCECPICYGVKSGLEKAFVIDSSQREALIQDDLAAQEIIKPYLNGRDIRRYHIDWKDTYLIYTYHGINMDAYPAVLKHLGPFKSQLENRATRQEWYELQQPQFNYSQFMDKPKIVFPDIAKGSRFALDEEGFYGSTTTFSIPVRDLYLIGLLNSSLGFFYFRETCAGLEGVKDTYVRFKTQYLESFPVQSAATNSPLEKTKHDRMIELVGQMLALNEQLSATRVPEEIQATRRQIDATDRQIDQLVYKLYDLTDNEVGIVEKAFSE